MEVLGAEGWEDMSRFDGLTGRALAADEGSYAPAPDSREKGLADDIAEAYLSIARFDTLAMMDACTGIVARALPALISDGEEFNPNAMLDALVTRVVLVGWPEHHRGLNLLLDPLVQALYDNGSNNLVVDLSGMEDSPSTLAFCLKGTEERPLIATYKARALNEFAPTVRHCRLSLQGSATFAAYQAQHSSVEVSGQATSVGLHAFQCDLFIGSVYQVTSDSAECRFHVEPGPDEKSLREEATGWFYSRANILLERGPTGEWQDSRELREPWL